MLGIVLLVCFVVVMILWGLASGGPEPGRVYSPWLAFIAVLLLGIVVFLTGTGVITWAPKP